MKIKRNKDRIKKPHKHNTEEDKEIYDLLLVMIMNGIVPKFP